MLKRLTGLRISDLRLWVILYLGLCIGYAILIVSPLQRWLAVGAVASWLGLAHIFGWGRPERSGPRRKTLPLCLLPLALWWVYLYLTFIFGEVDISAFFFHFQAGMEGHGGGRRFHLPVLYGLTGALMLASFAWLVYADRRWRSLDKILVVVLLVSNPFLVRAGQRGVSALSTDTAWLDREYVAPEILEAPEDPKNLIIVYLESVERTYADRERFGDAYADLRELGRSGLVIEGVAQVDYTGWTMAGMVASQCGTPLPPASFFQEGRIDPLPEIAPGVTCLGDLLDERGYEQVYMGGANKAFAGKGAFYTGHGFDQALGITDLRPRLVEPEYVNSWGLFDDTLFDLALDEVRQLDAGDEPYAFVALTLAAHPPYGEPARACLERQGEFDGEDILYSVECSAWLARRFYERLQQEGLLEDTVVVVASDHLAMKNSAWKDLIAGPRENTLILLGDGVGRGRVQRRASTLDTFPTILEAMGFEIRGHRAGLGTSLLSSRHTLLEQFGEDELRARMREEHALRDRIWNRP